MSQRFLIEVDHEGNTRACTEAVRVFLRTGSHFLTHAAWGCKDGVHKAWMIVDVDTRDEAWNIVPAQFRAAATIVMLNGFTMNEAEGVQAHLDR